jgi:hypothetical protein
MLNRLLFFLVLPFAVRAQDIPAGVKYDLTDLIYPRVGRLARVQGIVKLELIPAEAGQEVKLLGGPALLVQQPTANLAKWRTNQRLTVNCIFWIGDPDISKVRVPKGNAIDRIILRIFHLATYTEEYLCKQSSDKLSEPKVVQQAPLILEVEIVGGTNCLQTQTSLVASR